MSNERLKAQLRQVKNMDEVVTWLKTRRQGYLENLAGLKGDHLQWTQGRAQEITELLTDIQKA